MRGSEWKNWDDVFSLVSFIVLYCPLLPPSSVFLPHVLFRKVTGQGLRKAPVKFSTILGNGKIKAGCPCSLTYVKFIQTCLALLLKWVVHGFLNDVQIKRALSKT